MAGPLQIEHLELALDPEAPFHLNFARARAEIVCMLHDAVLTAAVDKVGLDVSLATRAVSLCGHVQLRGTLAVLAHAAASPHPGLREAVAAALEFRRDDRPELLTALLADPDPRVKARALVVLAARPVRRRVRHLAALKRLRTDPDPGVRRMARRVGVLRPRVLSPNQPDSLDQRTM